MGKRLKAKGIHAKTKSYRSLELAKQGVAEQKKAHKLKISSEHRDTSGEPRATPTLEDFVNEQIRKITEDK
jgi:hypothetical protein